MTALRDVQPLILRCSFAVGYLLLILGYGFTAAPWAAPDEPARHLRGLAAFQRPAAPSYAYPARTAVEAWYRQQATLIHVPGMLAPPAEIPCFAFHPERTGACLDQPSSWGPFSASAAARLGAGSSFRAGIARLNAVSTRHGVRLATVTYQGVYPPFASAIPGMTARLGGDPASSLLAGRLGAIAVNALLLVLAIACCGTGLRMAGLTLALTPIALFLGGTISPSGVEIFGAVSVLCGLASLSRGRPSRPAWLAVAAGGLALATARPLGPAWLALAVLGFAVAIGSRTPGVIANRPRWFIPAATLVVAAGAVNLVWIITYVPSPPAPGYSALERLRLGAHDVPVVLKELVGVLGWVDTPLPAAVYPLWWGLVLALVLGALLVGTARQRWLLGLLLIGLPVLVTLVAAVFAYGQPYTRAQGRWFVPVAIALPLLAAEILARRLRHPRIGWAFTALVTITVAASQLAAFVTNAHRYGLGNLGLGLDLSQATWTPHGGWTLWLSTSLIAVVLIAVAGIVPDRRTDLATTRPAAGPVHPGRGESCRSSQVPTR